MEKYIETLFNDGMKEFNYEKSNEVNKAIKQLKTDKVWGPGEINGEMIQLISALIGHWWWTYITTFMTQGLYQTTG